MGIYARYCLPKVVHFTCGLKPAMRQRAKVVPLAEGRVLEIGIGSGDKVAILSKNCAQFTRGPPR